MNIPLFIGLLALLGAASLWLGRNTGKKGGTHNRDEFFLMGRKLGLFAMIMTLLATQVGGGAILGASEEAFLHGWSVLFYPMGMFLGFIVLGLGYGAKMRRMNLTTVPEIFEVIYGSIPLRKIASLLSIASLYLILIGQGIAARKFFFSLGFHGDLLFTLFWAVLITYTVTGGLKAVVKTDILQALFIIGAFAVAFVACWFAPPVTSLPSLAPAAAASSMSTPWLTWLLMPLLFMLIEQDMGQRCFAAKTPRTVSIASIVSAILLILVSFVPIFFGILAAQRGLEIAPGASVLMTAVEALTNPVVATLVTCAILMAVVSTADSLLCSVSSNIVCDFPQLGKSLFASRAVTLLVGISTLALAFFFDNVLVMLMFSYKLAVSALFVPVTMAVWLKKPQKISAILSMVCGFGGFVLLCKVESGVPPEVWALALSFGGFFVGQTLWKYLPRPVSKT